MDLLYSGHNVNMSKPILKMGGEHIIINRVKFKRMQKITK